MGNVASQHAQFSKRPGVQCKAPVAANQSPMPTPMSSTTGDPDDVFTDEEKRLIRKTWSQLQYQHQQHQQVASDGGGRSNHNANRGVRVFLRIFELEPEAQSVFADFRNISQPSDLVANSVFRSHANRFMTAVDMTVHSLDALDVIVAPTLVRLGRPSVFLSAFSVSQPSLARAVSIVVLGSELVRSLFKMIFIRLGRRHVQFSGFHLRYMIVFERAMDDTWRTDLGRRLYSGATRHAWRKLFRFLTSRVSEGYDEALSEVTAVDSDNVDGRSSFSRLSPNTTSLPCKTATTTTTCVRLYRAKTLTQKPIRIHDANWSTLTCHSLLFGINVLFILFNQKYLRLYYKIVVINY